MYDSIVIGSGPAGLSAAVYAKRANVSVAVVEKEYEGTGQIAESENVNNYLGLPNSNGYELGQGTCVIARSSIFRKRSGSNCSIGNGKR